jgi:hypothetical protein
VSLKLTVEDLYHGGPLTTLLDWPVYALTVTAISAMLLVQIALRQRHGYRSATQRNPMWVVALS